MTSAMSALTSTFYTYGNTSSSSSSALPAGLAVLAQQPIDERVGVVGVCEGAITCAGHHEGGKQGVKKEETAPRLTLDIRCRWYVSLSFPWVSAMVTVLAARTNGCGTYDYQY